MSFKATFSVYKVSKNFILTVAAQEDHKHDVWIVQSLFRAWSITSMIWT